MPESSTELIARAVNARPITSGQGLLERLFNLSFGGFVYNQIWEDPDVDAEALQLDGDSRLMTISSGGCNVLNYLLHDVASIDAVDLNANHLHLLKLKFHGLRHFDRHEDFFAFFGHARDPHNVERFRRDLRPHLDAQDLAHWQGGRVRRTMARERYRYFERGLWKHGSTGTFLRFMHRVARHHHAQPERLLACTTLDQQEAVFAREIAPFFEMPVVRMLSRLPFLLHGIGVPPRQFEQFKNEIGAPNILQEYRLRVKRLACQFPVQTNYFAWQAFGGRYDIQRRVAIPSYLKAENFAPLQARVDRVRTHHTSMTGFLATRPPGSLNRFIMLDSQDWMSADQMTALWRQIRRVGRPGARIIFRTGASKSPLDETLPADLRRHFDYHEELSQTLFQRDRSAIYGGFHLYVMR